MKYSITIPAYKAVYFKECLESVLNQTYNDYEVVILNDCSPENIKDIVEECRKQKNGDKIRYYENEQNVGAIDVVDNWNKLLELAKGDYIICMGDDDKLAPNCLEEFSLIMVKYPNLDIYHTRTCIINENSEVIGIQEGRPEYETAYSIIWHIMFNNRSQFIGDFLFSRVALYKKGGYVKFPLAMASDIVTSCMMAQETGIGNSNSVTFFYRTSNKTITSNAYGKHLIDATLCYKNWVVNLLETFPAYGEDSIYKKQICNYLKRYFDNKLVDNIATDIAYRKLTSIFYWIFRRQRLRLSWFNILYAIIIGLYRLKTLK